MRWLIVVAVLASAGPAFAGDKADDLFEKGKKLLAKKKYAEACKTFEQVDELEPAVGAKLNVAKCYEEWGKLSRAFEWYTDAEKLASNDNDKRAPKIKELIDKLDPDVPRLTINVTEGADLDAAAIALDGEPLPVRKINNEQRVDPGPHVITYRANGKKRTKTVGLERGGARDVTLDLSAAKAKPDPEPEPGKDDKEPDPITPPVDDPGKTRRMIGLGMTGAGVVGIAVASVLTLSARGKYNDALDAHCMGMANACSDEGLSITGDARTTANIATAITLVGLAAAAGGIYLYVTAPDGAPAEKSVYVTPVVTGDGGGIVLGGGF